ncbi:MULTISPECIES: GyrI-like domain-containing protein [unclassified Roseateles]|uniref:GyrI-like domain-containing protein n=1 Tax=unclassified Roseateles TaxID=2626991 RepID=UPI0006FB9E36|nr:MULTISPECIES: GyrI-like domain-containing protein [unclassified Roseateles]KQW45425.1 hypothetical protein ASC81_10935 [Pelomonas sp. Root405]KRA72269.1 hypothetical protein ASD88_10935 [Pelomonas sp. Root662]
MQKIDFKKALKQLYHASATRIDVIDVPEMTYLMVDGSGDPNTSSEYAQAVEALFSVSYTAKFMARNGPQGVDYAVMPLEGLWWADDLSDFISNDRRGWRWTMMVMQPPVVTGELLAQAIQAVHRKKQLPWIAKLRIAAFEEGQCAQLLHVGPFSEEGPDIQRLHEFIAAKGALRGKHHEIYLSDIRRASPANWKTIIRQPMK